MKKLNGMHYISPFLKSDKVNMQKNAMGLVINLIKNPNLCSVIGKKQVKTESCCACHVSLVKSCKYLWPWNPTSWTCMWNLTSMYLCSLLNVSCWTCYFRWKSHPRPTKCPLKRHGWSQRLRWHSCFGLPGCQRPGSEWRWMDQKTFKRKTD